jgi:transcription-repair coupling factor
MKPSLLIGESTHSELATFLHKKGELVVSGASNETAKALLLSHIAAQLSLKNDIQCATVVTKDAASAEGLRHWLEFFDTASRVMEEPSAHDLDALPLDTLRGGLRFMAGMPGISILPRSLWEHPFPSFSELRKRTLILKKSQKIAFTEFVEELLDRGYEHSKDARLSPGEYRRSGDALDIYPIQADSPCRVSFNFDAVESIAAIDPETLLPGRSDMAQVELRPVSYEDVAPLASQVPKQAFVVMDDQDDAATPEGGMTLRFTAFPESAQHHVHLRYLSILKFYTVTDFLNDLRDKLQQEWTLIIVTHRVDELRSLLTEERVAFTEGGKRRAGAVTLVPAPEGHVLPHSLQNPDLKCAMLTDREIFSLRKAGKQRSIQKLALDFLTSLSPGDYVVHMEHGIGRFEGMTQKMVDDTMREYLELHYAEEDKLFIPVDQADKLSKFVHEEGQEPILTRLGTSEWKRITEKLRRETQETAKELLALYAKRAAAKGYSYDPDGEAMRKFEEAFPYALTPGQSKAVEEIKRDMEDPHPMDRLICGDVGFGKTEVAMRAAFKAVQDGKQVAVLAPITILADQHFHTFRERFKDFRVRIDMLSRFRTGREQKSTLEKLRKGDIDVVIGTHRLLQEDVKFHTLGLVIVDEEQRFGVKQKEKFKELRASVDLLTLTATPIPRTLNLGLHKLREITTITTPPPGRLPIITEVRKYSDELMRQSILSEIKRDGQCFVLHNRVETIDAFAEKLRALVPEASFIVGHGQLKPEDLEERILKFKQGKASVLVSSTIIENGIDLPRANTLIVNEAEKFGLAQLYQLRGRVGRGKVQAYAYFLYHSQRLQEDAKKRLRAIVEACELGSGFQVAMRDLEIRGAGEILGMSQSGTMQTVGVSHYLRMLKNAVEEIRAGRKEVVEEEVNVEILLPVEALIPAFYITDEGEKISMYQKLSSCEDEPLLDEFAADLEDEYGKLPKQVQDLFAVLKLKLACRKAGVVRIKAEEGRGGPSSVKTTEGRRDIVLFLTPRVTATEIMQLIKHHPQWKISGATLRIRQSDLDASGKAWLPVLARHIALLVPKKEKRSSEKTEGTSGDATV